MNAESFVFHYTGKLNQSYVMKSGDGAVVYEAVCEKITLLRDTPYRFIDHLAVTESLKMISHTATRTMGTDDLSAAISSSFRVDKLSVWDRLAQEGYGYRKHIKGLGVCYDITLNGEPAGTIEAGGTGLMNPKYRDSRVGQLPARGIYKVSCSRENIPGFFMLCFAFAKTEHAMKQSEL